MRVDAVVLDVDGVLVDVADSYRRAIIETVTRCCGKTISRDDIQAFKDAGGFNNDWELTDVGVLYVRARDAGFTIPVDAFAEAIHERGGGLDAARDILREAGYAGIAESGWEPTTVRETFQALYLGSDYYREIEGGEPPFEASGYIHDEPVLVTPGTLETMHSSVDVGVFTGRPAAEADIALDRVGLDLPSEHVLTMDDALPGKPDPEGLFVLADRLTADTVAFVGDTLDDVRTAVTAAKRDDRTFIGIGVLTGGLSGATGRRRYADVGADTVLESVNDLPEFLDSPS